MIINPLYAVKKGYITKSDKSCLTPNGYDLRLRTIYEISTDLDRILKANKKITHNAVIIVRPQYLTKDKKYYYFLKRNTPYEVKIVERVNIPKDYVGMVFSRSSFNRVGIIIRGTLFDSGFKGEPSLTIYPFFNIRIAKGTRIAQIIFVKANSHKLYNGQYQGE